jgi:hypothetical protein
MTTLQTTSNTHNNYIGPNLFVNILDGQHSVKLGVARTYDGRLVSNAFPSLDF